MQHEYDFKDTKEEEEERNGANLSFVRGKYELKKVLFFWYLFRKYI